jgi:tetratricopeptide (TPR) repeat protein
MGLTYLGLNNYELANENFRKAVDLTPANPDVYYYYALSLFAHRSPVSLSNLEAERIEMWLQTAIKIQPKRKYLILDMLLLQGAFKGKGKAVPAGRPEPEDLLRQALVTVQEEDELFEIEQHVTITDERNQELLSQLRGENASPAGYNNYLEQSLATYADLCDYPKGKDDMQTTEEGVQRLLDPQERERFFSVIYPPQKPEKESMESFFRPLWNSIKKTVLAIVLFFIALIVIAITDWMPDKTVYRDTPETYVEANYPDLSAQEKRAKIEEVTAQRAEQATKDSLFEAENTVVAWRYEDPEQDKQKIAWGKPTEEELAELPASVTEVEYGGIAKGWRMWATLIIILAAPLWWIVSVIITFRRYFSECSRRRQRNQMRENNYREAVILYAHRPTVADYMRFCQLYVGPNAGLVPEGDVLSTALRQAGISEADITKGKVYLFNCFFDCLDDGTETDNPEVVLRHMGLNVAVAMTDQVLYMTGIWDTTSPSLPSFKISSVMYSQIALFEKTEDQIIIRSNQGAELAPITTHWGDLPSLFQYQSTEQGDVLTYSRTRTTNRDEFYRSLIDMHGRYNKQ